MYILACYSICFHRNAKVENKTYTHTHAYHAQIQQNLNAQTVKAHITKAREHANIA